MNSQNLINLLAAVAPEVPGAYVLTFDELAAAGIPSPPWALGWHCVYNRAIATILASRGQWRGIEPVIALNQSGIAAEADERAISAESVAIETFLHEVAHAVPFVPDDEPAGEIEITPQSLARSRERLTTFAESDVVRDPIGPHGERFIRRAIHLCSRAWAAGWSFKADEVAAGPKFGVSHILQYAAALGDEPARLAGKSFSEIESIQPPAEFSQLYTRDVEQWRTERGAANVVTN